MKQKTEIEKAIELLTKSLNPSNAARFRAMPREDQEMIAQSAIDDGIIKYRAPRPHLARKP